MTTYRRISAVKTASEIIGFIAAQRQPVGGMAISVALGIAQGTVMSHLASLEDVRYVRRSGEEWELGGELAHLWARYKARLTYQRNSINTELDSLGVDE
jgi:DNA-binding IclR family transcriptional regulator